MPHMVRFLNSLDEKLWTSLFKSLEITVRKKGFKSSDPILVSDHKELVIFLSFVETLFLRFDGDSNGIINLFEGTNAYELFRGLLERKVNPVYAWPLFTYMLKFGYNPLDQPKDISEVRFLHWRWHEEAWGFSADRLQVFKIMASLKAYL